MAAGWRPSVRREAARSDPRSRPPYDGGRPDFGVAVICSYGAVRADDAASAGPINELCDNPTPGGAPFLAARFSNIQTREGWQVG